MHVGVLLVSVYSSLSASYSNDDVCPGMIGHVAVSVMTLAGTCYVSVSLSYPCMSRTSHGVRIYIL